MIIDIKEMLTKFEKSVIKNLDKENFNEIISFLLKEKCDYIEDIVNDYLELFNLPYNEFVEKYKILNQKYNGNFLIMASEDMNLFEEFYSV